MSEPINMEAVYKTHRTTVDGGISLTLDLPATEADNINRLFKLNGELLHVVVLTEAQINNAKHKKLK